MPQTLERLSESFGYAAEFTLTSKRVAESIGKDLSSPVARTHMESMSAVSLGGINLLNCFIYDINCPVDDSDKMIRKRAVLLGTKLLLLLDLVDDKIDTDTEPLASKLTYLNTGLGVLFDGKEYEPYKDATTETAFSLASHLHHTALKNDDKHLIRGVFDTMIPAVIRQIESKDLHEQLKLSGQIGADCASIGSASTQLVAGWHNTEAATATAHIGAYAEYLDTAFEIDEDINNFTCNFATVYLEEYGDSRDTRKQIMNILIDAANNEYLQGVSLLDDKQQAIYGTLKRFIDLRYKLFKPICYKMSKAFIPNR